MPSTCPNSLPAQVLAVIPARYGSTRFPGKPLVPIDGVPMVVRVWQQVTKVQAVSRVVVATDDKRIAAVVAEYGGTAVITDPNHPSGSDRVWEVAKAMSQYGWVLNVQGDEPYIDPAHLEAALGLMAQAPEADIVTLVTPIDLPAQQADFENPNVVKAVLGKNGRVFYFSRAAIPNNRDGETLATVAYRHLGLYLYRREVLERFTQLPPSPLEQTEKLEQLRALEAGMVFYAAVVANAPVGVDTPDDLQRLTPQR